MAVILDSHAHICQLIHFHGGLSDRPAGRHAAAAAAATAAATVVEFI